MLKKTKDYDMFIFRSDNREKIDQAHVNRLQESIVARNLLELRPIIVNQGMEVIDGQHRLLAAKALSIDIYYQVQKNLDCHEIILMNVVKTWKVNDYLNFYCKNSYPEYLKLKKFLSENDLALKIALNITMGSSKKSYTEFKEGRYVFCEEFIESELEVCWETINYIKKMNGYSEYTCSGRFWKALIKLVRHESFDKKKWKINLSKMVERFCIKARTEDYLMLIMEIYNYRNNEKIKLLGDGT